MKKFSKLIGFIVVFIVVLAAFSAVSFAEEQQYTGNLIPAMRSATTPSGVVTSSYNYAAFPNWGAFDHITTWGATSNSWYMGYGEGWIAYEFENPQVITKYTMITDENSQNSFCPKTWSFEGWDGNQWIVLDNRSDIAWKQAQRQAFTFNNTIAYKKYRVNIPAANDVYVVIGEIEMMASTVTAPEDTINLSATPGNNKIDLSWSSVEGATSYNIKRSTTPGGPYDTIANNVTEESYIDTAVETGITYYYVVSAVVNGVEGPNSNEASATIPQKTNQLKLVLEVKEEKQLSVSAELSDNTEMEWFSSDPAIATVDANGRVKALKPGNTVITCTSEDGSYTESINVLVVDLEYQLAVDLTIGDTCRLTVDDLANTANVTWSSYDPAIAAVSAKGKVTAVSEGLTYITASDKDGNEIGRIYIRVRQ